MTLNSDSITIGQVLTVLGDTQGSGHTILPGTKVTVLDKSGSDAYVRDVDATVGAWWVYYADLSADVSDLTLEGFKALVVEKAKAAAAAHGWCEVVDGVLKDLGLADYLPREQYVDVTFRVKVTAPKGTDDYTMREQGESQVKAAVKDGSLYYAHTTTLVE